MSEAHPNITLGSAATSFAPSTTNQQDRHDQKHSSHIESACLLDTESLRDAILTAAQVQYSDNNTRAARDILALLDHCGAQTAETLQTLGNFSFLLEDFAAASVAYRRALKLTPKDASLWVRLAHVSVRLEDAAHFENSLGQALQLEPRNFDALKLLADLNLTHGHFQDAERLYRQLAERAPEQIDLALSLGKCLFELGDIPGARAEFQRVLQHEPENQTALDNLAAVQSRASQPPVTLGGSSQLPGPAAVLLLKADAAFAKNNLAEASVALQGAVTHAPTVVPLRVCLGNLQFQLGKYVEARAAYLAAQAIEPFNIDILVRLAATALHCGDISCFERSLGRALELEPENPSALRLLADLNFQQQHFSDAAAQYRKLASLIEPDPQLLLLLGRCEFELGELAVARSTFVRALALNPNLEIACENIKVIDAKMAPAAKPGISGRLNIHRSLDTMQPPGIHSNRMAEPSLGNGIPALQVAMA